MSEIETNQKTVETAPRVPARTQPSLRRLNFLARIPLFVRLLALGLILGAAAWLGVSFYQNRDNRQFRLKSELAQLSKNETAVIVGYERRVVENDKMTLLLRADKDITYDDGHHELENIYLENYSAGIETPDVVSAERAFYVPDSVNPELFKINFIGSVKASTRDGVQLETEEVSFDRISEKVSTEAFIKFQRDNISGEATGAVVNIKDKRLLLNSGIDISVAATENRKTTVNFGSSNVNIKAGTAVFEKDLARLELRENVYITTTPTKASEQNFPASLKADRVVFEQNEERGEASGSVFIRLKSNVNPTEIQTARAVFSQKTGDIEFFDGVTINTQNNKKPITARGTAAKANRETENFSLSGNVEIIADDGGGAAMFGGASNGVKTVARSERADFDKSSNLFKLSGNANVERGREIFRGARIEAFLNGENKLQKIVSDGGSYLRTVGEDRSTEVFSDAMTFVFGADNAIETANARGNVRVKNDGAQQNVVLSDAAAVDLKFISANGANILQTVNAGNGANVAVSANGDASYSQIFINSPGGFDVLFDTQKGASVLRETRTGGRTTVTMLAPNGSGGNPRASNKKLTADSVKIFWQDDGKSARRAEAQGSAELVIEPLQKNAQTEKQIVSGNSLEADFYEGGNLTRRARAVGSAKVVLQPYAKNLAEKVLTANAMNAEFERATQAVERFTADGEAKMNSGDANGTAQSVVYTPGDGIVRFRGGEPTFWDSKARGKASEIDWNTRTETASLRGKTSTTYYSQKTTDGTTPFSKVSSPVYVTSNQADINTANGTAVYTGDARAWQENNYVRADRLFLNKNARSMLGEGNVQSSLYNARRKNSNGEQVVFPAYATAQKVSYSDAEKLLTYSGNVEIKQDTERLTAGTAQVYLNDKNEVSRTLAQQSVVITQPRRKAEGDWAQYTAADEVFVLRGNPANVQDAEQGSSQSAEITFYVREKRVVSGSANAAIPSGTTTVTPSGRVRTTFKVKKN